MFCFLPFIHIHTSLGGFFRFAFDCASQLFLKPAQEDSIWFMWDIMSLVLQQSIKTAQACNFPFLRSFFKKLIFSVLQGAFTFRGSMIDMPLLKQAQNIVTLATAIKKKWSVKWTFPQEGSRNCLKEDYVIRGSRKMQRFTLQQNSIYISNNLPNIFFSLPWTMVVRSGQPAFPAPPVPIHCKAPVSQSRMCYITNSDTAEDNVDYLTCDPIKHN